MTTSTMPPRSLAQRLDALAKANRVRCGKAQIKKELRLRLIALEDAFDEPCCQSAKTWELLMCVPGLGAVKVNKILNRARVAPSRSIGVLTGRQRTEILDAIAEREARLAAA